jgi:spermidine synthase
MSNEQSVVSDTFSEYAGEPTHQNFPRVAPFLMTDVLPRTAKSLPDAATQEIKLPQETHSFSHLERFVLLIIVMIASISGLVYEMVIGTVATELSGNGSVQFSFAIGLYLFAMGIGSGLSRFIRKHELRRFAQLETGVALLGGFSAICLYSAHAMWGEHYRIVMIIVTLLIGVGVGLEIPLLARAMASERSFEKALSEVLAFDYIGALFASLIFPLMLLPLMGVKSAAIFVGLFNMIAAFMAVWLGRLHHLGLWIVMGLVTFWLFVGLLVSLLRS